MTNEEIAREAATHIRRLVPDMDNVTPGTYGNLGKAVCNAHSLHDGNVMFTQVILAAINRAQSKDTERLDWLSGLSTFSYDELRDYMVDSPTYDTVIARQLFTIPSQNVQAPTLREAIDKARHEKV